MGLALLFELTSCRELGEDVVVEFAPPAAFEAQLSVHVISTDTLLSNFSSLQVNVVEDVKQAVYDGFGRTGFRLWKGNLEIGIRKGVGISPTQPYSFVLEFKLSNHLSRVVRFNLSQQGTTYDTIRLVSRTKAIPGLTQGSFAVPMNQEGTVGVVQNQLSPTRPDMAAPQVTILPGTHFVTLDGQIPTGGVTNDLVYIDGSQQPDLLGSTFQAGIGPPINVVGLRGGRRINNEPEPAFEIPLSYMSNVVSNPKNNGFPDTAVLFSQPVKVEIPLVPDLINPKTKQIVAPGDEINVSIYRPGLVKQIIPGKVFKVLEGKFDTIKSYLDSTILELKVDTTFKSVFNVNTGDFCKVMVINSREVEIPIYKDTLLLKPVIANIPDTFIMITSSFEGQKKVKVELNNAGKPVAVIYDVRPGTYATSWLVNFTQQQIDFKFSGYFNANDLMNEEEKASGPIPSQIVNVKVLPDNVYQYILGMNPTYRDRQRELMIIRNSAFPLVPFYINHNEASAQYLQQVKVPDLPNLYPLDCSNYPGVRLIRISNPGDPMEISYDFSKVILTRVGCRIKCSNGLDVQSDGYGYVFEVQNPNPQPGPLLSYTGSCVGVVKLEKGVASTFALQPNKYYENWSNYNGVDLYYHYQLTPPQGISPIQTNANNQAGGVATVKFRAITPRFYSMQYTVNGINNDLCK